MKKLLRYVIATSHPNALQALGQSVESLAKKGYLPCGNMIIDIAGEHVFYLQPMVKYEEEEKKCSCD